MLPRALNLQNAPRGIDGFFRHDHEGGICDLHPVEVFRWLHQHVSRLNQIPCDHRVELLFFRSRYGRQGDGPSRFRNVTPLHGRLDQVRVSNLPLGHHARRRHGPLSRPHGLLDISSGYPSSRPQSPGGRREATASLSLAGKSHHLPVSFL